MAMTETQEQHAKLEARIGEYLSSGGLFNPESMDHHKVRDLLIECRAALRASQVQTETTPEQKKDHNGTSLTAGDGVSVSVPTPELSHDDGG